MLPVHIDGATHQDGIGKEHQVQADSVTRHAGYACWFLPLGDSSSVRFHDMAGLPVKGNRCPSLLRVAIICKPDMFERVESVRRSRERRRCSLAMGRAPIFFLLFVCASAGQAEVSARAPLLDIPRELLGDVNKPCDHEHDMVSIAI